MEHLIDALVVGFVVGGLIGSRSGYSNGAYDAYYFARDPKHPGARKAGRIIYKGMRHMFGDIPDPDGCPPFDYELNPQCPKCGATTFEEVRTMCPTHGHPCGVADAPQGEGK